MNNVFWKLKIAWCWLWRGSEAAARTDPPTPHGPIANPDRQGLVLYGGGSESTLTVKMWGVTDDGEKVLLHTLAVDTPVMTATEVAEAIDALMDDLMDDQRAAFAQEKSKSDRLNRLLPPLNDGELPPGWNR